MKRFLLALVACGTPSLDQPSSDSGSLADDAGSLDAPVINHGEAGDTSGCAAESKLIYVVGSTNQLYSYDPATNETKGIGAINCVPSSKVTAMTVARDGTAYAAVRGSSGESMWKVSLKNASCTPTSYAGNQQGQEIFGLGFSTDGPNTTTETLSTCTRIQRT